MRAFCFTTIVATLALCAATALGQPKDKGEGYGQSGAPLEFGCEVITTANTAKAMQHRGATVRDLCFPWDTMVRWKADGGRANVVYSQTSTITFEGALASSRGQNVVDANGPDGPGVGLALSDGESDDAVVGRLQTYRQPGARPGVCSSPVVGPGRELVYPPCRVDGDCSGLGAGTCTSSPTDRQKERSCAFVVVQVSAADTRVCWRIDE